jgi:hypothetical protein
MKKDINGKYINSNNLFKKFTKITLNDRNNITSIKRSIKNLKIDIPNSNTGFNSITNITTKKCINSKKFITLDEKNININTETIFSKREIIRNKKSKSKNKNEKMLYIKHNNKPIKLIKVNHNNNVPKKEKNVTPNKNRLTKKSDIYKKKDKLLSVDNFTNNINFNINRKYNKSKRLFISETGGSNDSSNIINNNTYILSANNIDYSKSRNNIKSIFLKKDNKINKNIQIWKNSINCKTYSDLNDENFYNNKKLTNYQNFLDKSKNVKKRVKKFNKSENKTIINPYSNITNKNYVKRYNLKSEPKINIYRNRKGKNISYANDSTRAKNFLNKNIIIKKIKYYNLKIGKRDEINHQENQNSNLNININNTKRIKQDYINKKQIKHKINNHLKEKEIFLKEQSKARKEFKSCDIFYIKYKKKEKKHKKNILSTKKN